MSVIQDQRNSKANGRWYYLLFVKHLAVYLLLSTFGHADLFFSKLEELKSNFELTYFWKFFMLLSNSWHQQNFLNWKMAVQTYLCYRAVHTLYLFIIKYCTCRWCLVYLQSSECNLSLTWSNKGISCPETESYGARIPWEDGE